jgi:hypothetical protein
MEDTPHHFAVTLHHDGEHVTAIHSEAIRAPWSTCPDAGARLDRLIGMKLARSALAVNDRTPHWEQCTHQFDIAGLAIAQAARGPGRREYVAEVQDGSGPLLVATLSRDGTPVFDWRLEFKGPGSRVIGAPPIGERELKGINEWAADALDETLFEAVTVLGRAIFISGSRYADLDRFETLADMGVNKRRAPCYSFDPKVVTIARRNKGSSRWFTTTPPARFADESLT